MKHYELIIIGGGVSGTFAAISETNYLNTLIIDKNDNILTKFIISGKGRSNITNTSDIKTFIDNLIDGNKFLYPSITKYNSENIIKLLVELKVGHYFKEKDRLHLSDNNSSFRSKINKIIVEKKIDLSLKNNVLNVEFDDNKFILETKLDTFSCDNLIIATGGLSYKEFGCTGFGYEVAKKYNHKLRELYPIGVGFHINDLELKKLQGISVENVQVRIYWDDKLKYTETGDLMFTHYGIGGPVIRRASGYVTKYLLKNKECKIILSFMDKRQVVSELHLNKRLFNCFKDINDSVVDYLLPNIKNCDLNNITNKMREEIINSICEKEYIIKKTENLDFAINTGGGIELKNIDPNTFESKLQSNLYFIGEVLDINPRTNGFNITSCYAMANKCIEAINNKNKV